MEDRGLAAKHKPEDMMKPILILLTIIVVSIARISEFHAEEAEAYEKECTAARGALKNLSIERDRLQRLLESKDPQDPACVFIANQLENNLIFINRERAILGKGPLWD